MAKDDQEEAFERVLTATLSRAIDFSKFAEAKNAAILTFSSAWILASVNILNNTEHLSGAWRIAFSISVPLFAFSSTVSILSFLPITQLSTFINSSERRGCLIYFGDIAKISPKEYAGSAQARYFPDKERSVTQTYIDDLSIQIAVNSAIALRKFRFFDWAAIPAFAGVLILLVPACANLASILWA